MIHQANRSDFGRQISSADQAYLRTRAGEEDHAATAAACPEARERHEEMAQMYRERIRFGSARYEELPVEPSPAAVGRGWFG